MSVNTAISLPDIYMSRLENDTKSFFRRSLILFNQILSISLKTRPVSLQFKLLRENISDS